MDPQSVYSFLGGLVSAGAILGWFLKAHRDLRGEIEAIRLWNAKQELKIEACWTHLMNNARAAAAIGGWGTMQSPLQVNDLSRDVYARTGFTAKLHDYFRTIGRHLPEQEMEMDLEVRFREELLKEICLPYQVIPGTCIAIAIAIAREAKLDA